MLQNIKQLEAGCEFYVEGGSYDRLEQNSIRVLTVTPLGIATLTVQQDWIIGLYFLADPGDVMKQTSPDDLYVEECPFYILHTSDFCYLPQ